MTEGAWEWKDRPWRDAIGGTVDPAVFGVDEAVVEGLRRAVDLRDTLANEEASGALVARAVFLVDLFNNLAGLLSVDTTKLWPT